MSGRYEDKYLTVRDGLKLHYRDYPGSDERPPLLCLHGLTRNSRDFEVVAPEDYPWPALRQPDPRERSVQGSW